MKCLALVMIFLVPMTVALSGCRRDMFNQPKSNPLRESDFFPDGAASRPIPLHTVARGDLENDDAFFTGMIGTNLVTTFPFPVTREVLERGRQRFEINCAPCHGETGEGNGVVVARGFPRPPSYHLDRLRTAPIGHFFDVMTRGYGVMFAQAERVTPEDRWAIAAYIRALQLSENATAADVPASEMAKLQTAP
jgi:cytochrome c553